MSLGIASQRGNAPLSSYPCTKAAGDRLLRTLGPRFEEVDAELAALSELREKPAGTGRITTTDYAADAILWPRMTTFLRQYPDIKIEIIIDYGLTDIVAQRFDAGVRNGEQVAKDMIAVRIGPDMRMAVVGTPSYFVKRPPPKRPQDLIGHNCINLWSGLAGAIFLDWLAPSPGLRWLDLGCGSGAFTELVIQLCAPAEAQGVDPSESQLAFARTRPAARMAKFSQGDAMALPSSFDAAVMALVLFFVPEPAKGVAEMARVVRPGGLVAAYLWDFGGGGFPSEPIQAEMRAVDVE